MSEAAFEPAQMSPHSQDAEEALLGSVLINPNAWHEISFLSKHDFFILRNGWVFEAMERIDKRGDQVEYLTVIEELRSQGRLNDAGGAAYITYLASNLATSVYAEQYARVVERAAIRRKMLKSASEIAELAREESQEVYTSWEWARRSLDAVLPVKLKTAGLQPISEGYSSYFDRIEYLYGNRNVIAGVPTGFTDLDNLLNGLQDSELIILAGRPSMGKTSLQVNMLVNAAKAGQRGAFFSLEMAQDEVINRIVSAETSINGTKLRHGHLTESEWKLFVGIAPEIESWKLQLDATPNQTTAQIRAKCLHLRRQGVLDFVFVDYLQLIKSIGNRQEPRHEQVSQIAKDLKNLARELQVPVFAAAQLSRAVEGRTDKRPIMSDLAESGAIEQVADVIMFLYRDEYYNAETERPNEADVIIAKNRNGATGAINLYFRKEITQFANLKRIHYNVEELQQQAAKKAGRS